MFKNIIFYSHFHLGDLHVSRQFVKVIIEKVLNKFPDTKFSYIHKYSKNVLLDLEKKFSFVDSNITIDQLDYNLPYFKKDDTLFINTWYGVSDKKIINKYGISFDCVYFNFDEVCKKELGFELSEICHLPQLFYPHIDYDYFKKDNVDLFVENNHNKKVFISNGLVYSYQVDNFLFSPIIKRLADRYPDITFILSNKMENWIKPNVLYSKDIIGEQDCDLNENAYLSQYCDLIIGRGSGAFTFSFNQNNLFKYKKNFLCISNLEYAKKFWLGPFFEDKVDYESNITFHDFMGFNELETEINLLINSL